MLVRVFELSDAVDEVRDVCVANIRGCVRDYHVTLTIASRNLSDAPILGDLTTVFACSPSARATRTS
jgi:hypothetical protein